MSLSNLSEKLRARQEAVAAKKNNVTNAIRDVGNGVTNAKNAVNGVVTPRAPLSTKSGIWAKPSPGSKTRPWAPSLV